MKTNSLDFDAQALREKILDLAMRGKLVKQDPNDEPASVLLEKIKAEKAKLVKEGKIKKNKPLPEITDDEKPFDIPDSWEWVRLGDVITTINGDRGKNYPGKKYWQSKGVPFLNAACLSADKYIEKDKFNYISNDRYNLLRSGFIEKNDILYCIRGSLGKVGIVNINKGAIASSLIIVRPFFKEQQNIDFLYYILSSSLNIDFIKKHRNGSAQPNIPGKDLLEMIIPLPPLEEQSRIAAKIAQLFALLRKVESSTQQYAKLQTLLKSKVLDLAMRGKLVKQDPNDEPASVLLEKIKAEKDQLIKEKKIKRSKPLPPISDEEKPFEIPDSWEWVRLGDIGAWAAGATPSRKHPEYYGGTIPWLKTGDLNDGIVNETSEKITELGVKNSSVKVNEPGNVLIAMYGATIGKLGIVGNQELVTNQACCGCSLFDGVHNWYLFYYLLASRKRLIDLGSGGAQPNISKNKIEKFTFPLPPLEEQSRIAAKVAQLFALLRKSEGFRFGYARKIGQASFKR